MNYNVLDRQTDGQTDRLYCVRGIEGRMDGREHMDSAASADTKPRLCVMDVKCSDKSYKE